MSDIKDLISNLKKAKEEVSSKAPQLGGEFHSPGGHSPGEYETYNWQAIAEDEEVVVAIDLVTSVMMLKKEELNKMQSALEFLESIDPEDREIILSLLEE